ncbi:MAG: response regulator transcription factor [Thermoleophilia bacterium]
MMHKPPIRIIIVDDHPVVLEGLSAGLGQFPNIHVVGTAASEAEGKEVIAAGGFDLLVTDLYLSATRDGLELMRYARGLFPELKVIVLSYSHQPNDIFDANQAGADAYLVKDSDLEEIAEALETVMDGGRPSLKPELEAALWKKLRDVPPARLPLKLTEREWEILRLMTLGGTNEEIAQKLYLSPRVVRRSNTAIYQKLSVRNRSEAIAHAAREKWFK